MVLDVTMFITLSCNAFAETIQDSLEQRLEDLADQYNSADSNTQSSVAGILEGAGLGDLDLGSLTEGGVGDILGDLGNSLAVDDILGLVEEAFASGSDMIGDALGGGLGTSDGSNTATTKPATTGSPNVIIANTSPVVSTNAVGVPQLTTKAPANAEDTTAANIVGAGITTAGTTAAPVIVDDGMSSSTVAVLVVLSVSTIAIIIAIVIFFIMKKK